MASRTILRVNRINLFVVSDLLSLCTAQVWEAFRMLARPDLPQDGGPRRSERRGDPPVTYPREGTRGRGQVGMLGIFGLHVIQEL